MHVVWLDVNLLLRALTVMMVACALTGEIPLARAQFGPGGMDRSMGPSSLLRGNEQKEQRRSFHRHFTPANAPLVVELRVEGNESVSDAKVRSNIQTRPGRAYDPEIVQSDVRHLMATGQFQDVRTFQRQVPGGIMVTIEVVERPTIHYIKFLGNRSVREKKLGQLAELQVGDSLNQYAVEEALKRILRYYHTNGYPRTHITTVEGSRPGDRGITYMIHEGKRQLILTTRFVGNTIGSDARLRTQVQSKRGFLWLFQGKMDLSKVDEDVDKLTAYYRSLGFFSARVGREIEYSRTGKFVFLTFVVDEGPRYVVRNVSFVGHEKFSPTVMDQELVLKSGDYFNLKKLNKDVNQLRDLYGTEGHIYADIQAEPRFLEEPGQLDLVYNIQEGEVYRVGSINVHIKGDHPHTRHSVVLPRIEFHPGDVLNIKQIRDSERRLKASQLFRNDPAAGVSPRIVVRPPEEAVRR